VRWSAEKEFMVAKDPSELRAIWGEVVAKAWQDDDYREAFLKDPKEVLVEAGMELPKDVKYIALEDKPDLRHVILPYDTPFDAYKDTVNSLLEKVLPLPAGLRVEIVQNTADTRYWNLPAKPPGFTASGELTDEELALVAGGKGGGGSAVNVNYEVNVNAAVNVQAGVNVVGGAVAVVVGAVAVLL
jgi:hypothetical protein